ncbi:MAG: signal peptidase II [Cycloclasticus sp. symbiont of Poecilosclerida sp. M]|nr:MAG: signal peptidase II [Cycloclasticus sp. symbiont of Poecilosclerida sp. M]
MLKWTWISAVVLLLDQLSKLWVVENFALYESVSIIPYLNLTYVHNTGAAFSFLSTAGGWQRWVFAAIAVIAVIILTVWLKRLKRDETWLAFSLSLILGGAIGNLYDRIAYGYVIDFFDVYYQQWHWPVFNVADSAISVGVTILLIDTFFNERRESSTA